jgi:hypothetical protein
MELHLHLPRRLSQAIAWGLRRARAGRAPPLADTVCAACRAPSVTAPFCAECLDRAQPHRDDDPYDDLGGEGEAG